MTTQLPYEPPKYGNYPTAPPWATAVAPEPAPEAVPAPTQHGQLMVAHPELIPDDGPPRPPSVLPTGLFTLLFFPLGAISAARRARTAARGRNPRSPYWITFGLVMTFNVIVMMAIFAAAVPAYRQFREDFATQTLENSIKSSALKPTAVACTPTGTRGADDLRMYRCTLTLTTKKTVTIDAQADSKGNGQQVR